MATLTKDLITKPALWRMALLLHPTTVDVALSSPYDEGPLVFRTLRLDDHMSQLEGFEELVYENPLLLSDFSRVEVLIDTPQFTIVPSEIRNADVRQGIISALWPSAPLAVIANEIAGTDDTLLMGVDEGVMAFINRTFLDVTPRHPVSVIASYFAPQASQGSGNKFFVNLRSDGAEVAGFVDGTLAVANSYAAATPEDIAYFILASAQTAGLSLDEGEFLLCGDINIRQKVTPLMRDFAKRVMPAIFPSEALRLGTDAVKTPFPLIIANLA